MDRGERAQPRAAELERGRRDAGGGVDERASPECRVARRVGASSVDQHGGQQRIGSDETFERTFAVVRRCERAHGIGVVLVAQPGDVAVRRDEAAERRERQTRQHPVAVVAHGGRLQGGQGREVLARKGHTPSSARGTATVSVMPETALELDSPPRWDLTSLFPDVDAALAALAEALRDCNAFRDRYRGRVAELEADELLALLDELAALDNRLSRLGSYSGLALSTNITGEVERDADAAIEQGLVEAQNALRFFELEWLHVDDERAATVAANACAGAVPLLPHLVAALPPARPDGGRGAHARRARAGRRRAPGTRCSTRSRRRCRSRSTAATTRSPSCSRSSARPERATRIGAYDALFTALEPHAGVQAQVYDSVVSDRLAMDRIRDYAGPRAARDLSNELAP